MTGMYDCCLHMPDSFSINSQVMLRKSIVSYSRISFMKFSMSIELHMNGLRNSDFKESLYIYAPAQSLAIMFIMKASFR